MFSKQKNFALPILFIIITTLSCSQTVEVKYSPEFDKKPMHSLVVFPLIIIQQESSEVTNAFAPSWLQPFNDCNRMESDDCTITQKNIVDWISQKFANYRIIDPDTINFEMEGLVIPTETDAVKYVVNHYSADAIFVFKVTDYLHGKIEQAEEYTAEFVYKARDIDHLSGQINIILFDENGSELWRLNSENSIQGDFPLPLKEFFKNIFEKYEAQLNELVERIKKQK